MWNKPKDGSRGLQANSFSFRTAATWNNLPANVVDAPTSIRLNRDSTKHGTIIPRNSLSSKNLRCRSVHGGFLVCESLYMIIILLSKADLESYYGELMNISSNDYVETNNVIKVNSMLTTINEENNSVGTNRKNEFVSQQINNLINIETYGSMSKLLEVTAWIIRFTKNIHLTNSNRNLNKYISSDERGIVLNIWLKDNQRELVKNEKYDNIKCVLNLIAENDSIIRAFGRIQRANLTDEIRKPIMLERNHKLAKLILWECHRRVKHNGVRETLVEFQAQYWVTKSKSFVKKILYRCTLCRFTNSCPYSYPKSPELTYLLRRGLIILVHYIVRATFVEIQLTRTKYTNVMWCCIHAHRHEVLF